MAAYSGKAGVDDMVMLTTLSEAGIRDNLKKRYNKDIIYTYIGHVLVSVNPFKNIKDLYSERLLSDYRGKYPYELPPHIFALADQIYRQLMQEGKNQCCIISGESGAGKTEASKKILQYIAAASSNSDEVVRVKDVILESNPLLEAFGNAKTVRNNNSSRFGKYMEIQFNLQGDPEGGRITNYLLEKSRVVFQGRDERNFHVFYQLLAGADATLRQEFNLRSPQEYFYTNQSGCFKVNTIDDVKEYQDTVRAMEVMGLDANTRKNVLKTLAAVLTLGNVQFAQNDKDESYITNQTEAQWVAYLLDVDEKEVQNALCLRTIESGSARASIFKCPQDVEGAVYSRDALAKEIYSRLFDYMVHVVNLAMYKDAPQDVTIGILDIYGFEIFDKNGFEQLSINYVNEKLQQIFIQLTLKQEQEEYKKENIQWQEIPFFNNEICCQLIESKRPIGILTLLDDVCNFPKGTDMVFHQKMGDQFGTHAHFSYGNGEGTFVVKHYAGPVEYCVDGFLDKNKDTLFNDLMELCMMSNSPLLQILFPPEKGKKRDRKRPTTAGFKIKQSINELVDKLALCTPSYIRCMKPNDNKKANDFDAKRMLHQVQYLGLLENVRVRRAGFAYRHPYRPFFYRYRVLCDKTWPEWRGSEKDGAIEICKSMHLNQGDDYQLGTTKIFIRKPESVFALEETRERTVFNYANRIQRFFTKFALQQWYYDLQMNGHELLRGKKERRRLSVAPHKFYSDYINFRENFELKDALKSKKEKVHFADMATKWDRRGKQHRRVVLVTDRSFYSISLEKNPDKDARGRKPYVYVVKRREELKDVRGVQLSPFQDGFMLWQLPDYDVVLECKRKTELLATARCFCPSLKVNFSANWSYSLKGGKSNSLSFSSDSSAGTGAVSGKLLGGSISVGVAPGESKDTQVPVEAPLSMPKVNAPRRQIGGGMPMGGGGGARKAPVPGGGNANPAVFQPRSPRGNNNNSGGHRPAPGLPQNSGGGAGFRGGPPQPNSGHRAAPSPGRAPPGAMSKGPKRAPKKQWGGPKKKRGGPGPRKKKRMAKKGRPKGKGKGKAKRFKGPGARKKAPPKAHRAAPGVPPAAQQKKVRALWDFEQLNPDELALKAGDVIVLLEDSDKDWWKGEKHGVVGLFPATYVQRV